MNNMKKPVASIIMGSDSDLPIMKEAASIFDEFSISYEITVVSAHRTPKFMFEYAASSLKRGVKVIVAGAGGSAHLPGMVASLTTLPVIGVPIKTKSMKGLDSLLSIVQMPPGIPVATVAVNGAKNAGLLAARILSINDQKIRKKLSIYAKVLGDTVMDKSTKLKKQGYKRYLENKNKT